MAQTHIPMRLIYSNFNSNQHYLRASILPEVFLPQVPKQTAKTNRPTPPSTSSKRKSVSVSGRPKFRSELESSPLARTNGSRGAVNFTSTPTPPLNHPLNSPAQKCTSHYRVLYSVSKAGSPPLCVFLPPAELVSFDRILNFLSGLD